MSGEKQIDFNHLNSVVMAITGDYDAFYDVDVSTGDYDVYGQSNLAEPTDSPVTHGTDFFGFINDAIERLVYDNDKLRLHSEMTPENLIKKLECRKKYYIDYRVIIDETPVYYQFKVVHMQTGSKEGHFIIGVRNIDEEVRNDTRQKRMLEEARNREDAANKAKTSFLFNMSHDLRTPLTSIIGVSRLALKHVDNSDYTKDCLNTIYSLANNLSQLIVAMINMADAEGRVLAKKAVIPDYLDSVNEEEEKLEQHEISIEGMCVLVVDDNNLHREIAADILHGMNVDVECAENGEKAVELIKNSLPGYYDLVLMDIQMPGMDGLEAARQIRALSNKELSSIPIAAMSANALIDDRRRALEAGMNAHIAKPIDIVALTKVLINCMVNQSMSLSEQLKAALSQANRDVLTGVGNKTAYIAAEDKLDWKLRSEKNQEFGIIMCDVNWLKIMNDTLGHDAGDRLLINACRIICTVCKHSPVFRVGGDEFTVILTGEDYAHRRKILSTLRTHAGQVYKDGDVNPERVSFATGLAIFDASTDESVNDVVKRADRAMYEHKRTTKSGRDMFDIIDDDTKSFISDESANKPKE